MAIRPPNKPPGSITQPADNKNERIAEVSNVNRVVSEMQKKVDQQLAEAQIDVGQMEGIEDVQNSMIKVLGTLNSTVGSIGYGFAKIASDTGKAGSEAFKQYGKAISADISLNKQNIIATALSQSSPIFGYFAAKFVETDVFQSAKEKMKANISDALGGVTSKFREGFGNLIGRAKSRGEKEKPVKGIKPKTKQKIPKMQTGGYVQKAGMAFLHPAEVVVPIDKILSRIDESIDVSKEIANISRRAQLHSLAKMSTYVKGIEHFEKVGIFKGFLRAMKEVQTQYQEPSDVRMLRALLAIQDSLGAQIGTAQQIWQKMLVEHPTFRQISFAMRGLSSVFSAPFKFVYSGFKERGGYRAHLSRSSNPFEAMVENTGLIYADGMWKLDNIALFTKATAEATRDLSSAITGKKYKALTGVPSGLWSIFGLSRALTNWATKHLANILGYKELGKKLTKEREFFVTTILDKLLARRRMLKEVYGEMGIHKTIRSEMGMEKAREGLLNFIPPDMAERLKRLNALPVSEIHLEQLSKGLEQYMVVNKKTQQKLLGYTSDMSNTSKGEYKELKMINRRQKRKSIFGLFGGAFGAVKSFLGSGLGILTGVVLPWLTNLGSNLIPKLVGFLASKALWIPVAGVISSALLGTAIGVLIRKLLGIDKSQKEKYSNLDKITKEMSIKNLKKTRERMAGSRTGDIEGYKKNQALQLQAQLGGKESREGFGWFGRNDMDAITEAQREYMNENMNEYLKYGSPQLQELRAKWLKEVKYPGKRWTYPGKWYGKEREAAFLKYVQTKGKPLTEMQKQVDFTSYAEKIKKQNWQKSTIGEKMGIVFKKGEELAKEKVAETLAGTEAMKKAITEQTSKMIAGTKEAGHGMATAVTQATTAVTTTITNNSNTVNNATQRVRDIFSEYEHAIIKGDYMSEGF